MFSTSPKHLPIYHALALTGMVGMILLIVLWNGWLGPDQDYPRSIEILLLASPLLLFLRGIIKKTYDTHIFVTFLALLYFLLGVWYLISPLEWVYGLLLVILSGMQFIGAYYYARTIMIRDRGSKH